MKKRDILVEADEALESRDVGRLEELLDLVYEQVALPGRSVIEREGLSDIATYLEVVLDQLQTGVLDDQFLTEYRRSVD